MFLDHRIELCPSLIDINSNSQDGSHHGDRARNDGLVSVLIVAPPPDLDQSGYGSASVIFYLSSGSQDSF